MSLALSAQAGDFKPIGKAYFNFNPDNKCEIDVAIVDGKSVRDANLEDLVVKKTDEEISVTFKFNGPMFFDGDGSVTLKKNGEQHLSLDARGHGYILKIEAETTQGVPSFQEGSLVRSGAGEMIPVGKFEITGTGTSKDPLLVSLNNGTTRLAWMVSCGGKIKKKFV